MAKRYVKFANSTGDDIQEPKAHRLREDNSVESDDDENASYRNVSYNDNVLTEDDIEGQEEETIQSYGKIKITPFNLKEEMEEGHFDTEGNYIADKSTDYVKDQWLESIDWSRVDENHKKKVSKKTGLDDEIEQMNDREKIRVVKDILSILHPGENALIALRRLGGSKKKGKNRLGDNSVHEGQEVTRKKKEQLLRLTELVDLLLQQGDFEIYSKTFEKLSRELERDKQKFADPDGDDELEKAFADKGANQNETRNKDLSIIEKVMWEYKWEDAAEAQIYGPYSNSCMRNWNENGYFKDGVFCRKV